MSSFYCLVLLLAAQSTHAAFRWSNCLANKHDIDITSLDVKPDPVVMPGDIHITVNGATTRNITDASLKLEIYRKVFLADVYIPCIANIGSCTYDNICTILDRMEKENWAGITMGLGTDIRTMLKTADIDTTHLCPLKPTQLSIPDGVIHLPKVSGLISHFSAGEYHIKLKLTETESKSDVMCLDLHMNIVEDCVGLACIIG